MNEHERRVSDALEAWKSAQGWYECTHVYMMVSDAARLAARAGAEHASDLLRRSVIMAEANGVRCV